MKKTVFFPAVLAVFLLCSCSSTPYEVKEEDKLTDRELYHLFDYSRTFILSSKRAKLSDTDKKNLQKDWSAWDSSRKVKLSESDKKFLMSKDPEVRVHYTGPKTGNISLSWLIPGRLQIIVSASGRLDLSGSKQAEWSLKVIHYKRDCDILPEEIGIPVN